MTDVNRWPELVQTVGLRCQNTEGEWQDGPYGEPIFGEYIVLPFNEYTLGHLLGMLARSEDNGDWHDELISVCVVAMEKAGLTEVSNNWGDRFTIEEVRLRARSFISKGRKAGKAESCP